MERDRIVAELKAAGCTAENWDWVEFSPDFVPGTVVETHFSGRCRLGAFRDWFDLPGGVRKPSGVYRATLHNVAVGENARIADVRGYVANYEVGEGAFIGNVDRIYVEGESTFGNGVEVAVLCETGGREVTMHDGLSAQEAYFAAMYRHRPILTARLKRFAASRALERRSGIGRIGARARIVDAGVIRNVFVGPGAVVEGAARLSEGSLMSREGSPVVVGRGVIADGFIFQDGAKVEDAVRIARCYVGQACRLGRGYAATDSLFFCNCQGENGEACSVFAGPFTVTHHKSTLLIAGLFSFMNAGSGSNQSNHMYKLGPIHQGALERGAKTASDSYILWPARIGAFSLVMGRHATNPDTSALPFSYLIESRGVTYLAPGVNLKSVGTIRDAQKWPRRDLRAEQGRLDQVNFNLLSPYTIGRMYRGLRVLEELKSLSGATSDTYAYQSARITSSALEKGIGYYRLAIEKFLGNSLISRLESLPPDRWLSGLAPEDGKGLGEWVDIAGLLAPKASVGALIDAIEGGEIDSCAGLAMRFAELHSSYYELEWSWAWPLLLEWFGLVPGRIDRADLRRVVERWMQSVLTLDRLLYEDAKKEFSLSAKTGFGFDGMGSTTEADFAGVRGEFETNPFVCEITAHMARKEALGRRWLERLH